MNETSASKVLREPAKAGDGTSHEDRENISLRFTIDGSDALEARLRAICDQVSAGIEAIVPPRKVEAVVLGGGYGRGEGGVLRTETGDQPYNDIEFYVFVHGARLWNERKYGASLCALGERLSTAGLHVEFKLDSLERLRRMPISMFKRPSACSENGLSVSSIRT